MCAFVIAWATAPEFISTACKDLSLDAVKRSTQYKNIHGMNNKLQVAITGQWPKIGKGKFTTELLYN